MLEGLKYLDIGMLNINLKNNNIENEGLIHLSKQIE